MRRYEIWDRVSNVITPIGEVLSPQDWIDRYPYLALEDKIPVVAAGPVNGAYCGELNQMKYMMEMTGAEFDSELTPENLLAAIEEFEDALNEPNMYRISPEERIASALEAQVMLSLPDYEEGE